MAAARVGERAGGQGHTLLGADGQAGTHELEIKQHLLTA